MNIFWIQIIAVSVAASASVGWLLYYFIKRQNINSQVSVILGDEDSPKEKYRVFFIERAILDKTKLDDKHVWWIRVFFLAIIVAVLYILGPIIGITYVALFTIILFFGKDPLNETKTEIDNLSYAVYVVKATYGQGLSIDDSVKALRESGNSTVVTWTDDYSIGKTEKIPHRFSNLLDKLYMFQSSGKNATNYIESVREQIENKAEMVNQAILAIREVLFIKISYYVAVPIFILMSYSQARDVWTSWIGAALAALIMVFFLGYNVLLKRISISTRELVDF